jgi:hypothetical protein
MPHREAGAIETPSFQLLLLFNNFYNPTRPQKLFSQQMQFIGFCFFNFMLILMLECAFKWHEFVQRSVDSLE